MGQASDGPGAPACASPEPLASGAGLSELPRRSGRRREPASLRLGRRSADEDRRSARRRRAGLRARVRTLPGGDPARRRDRSPVRNGRRAGGASLDAVEQRDGRSRRPAEIAAQHRRRVAGTLARRLDGRGTAGAAAVNVAFVHPDLGLGGAERLVVDAASELRARGHRVVLLTARHDPGRTFPETIDGSLDVRVGARLLPAHVAGRLRAPCAIARTAWLGVTLRRLPIRPDVVLCDLVPHAIPFIRRVVRRPVVLYCHYPDRLLTPPRTGIMHWYRLPIDRLEERGTARADLVLVNSRFTAQRLGDVFPNLDRSPIVLHPGVAPFTSPDLDETPPPGPIAILSICRFDPRKNLALAIDAFAAVRARLPDTLAARLRLVLA